MSRWRSASSRTTYVLTAAAPIVARRGRVTRGEPGARRSEGILPAATLVHMVRGPIHCFSADRQSVGLGDPRPGEGSDGRCHPSHRGSRTPSARSPRTGGRHPNALGTRCPGGGLLRVRWRGVPCADSLARDELIPRRRRLLGGPGRAGRGGRGGRGRPTWLAAKPALRQPVREQATCVILRSHRVRDGLSSDLAATFRGGIGRDGAVFIEAASFIQLAHLLALGRLAPDRGHRLGTRGRARLGQRRDSWIRRREETVAEPHVGRPDPFERSQAGTVRVDVSWDRLIWVIYDREYRVTGDPGLPLGRFAFTW